MARYPVDRYNVSVMDSGYQLLTAKYVRRQAKQLAEQLDGVRAAEDIEFVHRARVATRRLRAALKMSDDCFVFERLRRWRKAIRRTTANLSSARDRDVQIEFLCGALLALDTKECFPGIARVLVRLERDRERLQRNVVKAADRLEADGVLRQMRRATRKVLRKAASAGQEVRTATAHNRTRRHILRQLDEMLRHQDCLARPDDREGHHAMRIAAKRLRYTLEIAQPLYPEKLDEAVVEIKRIQTLLGDVHDCDVWIEHLDTFASHQRDRMTALFGHPGRFARLEVGVDYLRRDRAGYRQEAFGQLVEHWAALARRRFWEGLASVVVSEAESSAVARPRRRPDDQTHATPTSELQPAPGTTETRPLVDASGRVWQAARRPLLTTGSRGEQ